MPTCPEKVFVVLSALGACAPSTSPAPPRASRATGEIPVDVLHYDAEVRIDPEARRVSGTVEIKLRILGDGDHVALDARELVIDEVRDEDGPVPLQRSAARLRVSFSRRPSKGDVRTVTVRYHGQPSRGLVMDRENAYTVFHTDSWLPCRFDPADKATLALTLLVPRTWTSVATGTLRSSETTDEWNRSVFDLRRPYSAYLFGFAAGQFRETTLRASDRVELRFLGRGRSAEELARVFAATEPALAFFESRAGVPYPGDRYTQVLVPKTVGQEMAGLSLLSNGYADEVLREEREDWLVVHELSHQWWGNLVTCARWNDFWMHEALATFMTAAYKEVRWGRDAYDREIELARRRYGRLRAEGRDRALAPGGSPTSEEVGGPLPYAKGTLVLHLLRTRLGDEPFFRGIQRFTQQHAGGTATSRMLQQALEGQSRVDLAAFFADHVHGDVPLPLDGEP